MRLRLAILLFLLATCRFVYAQSTGERMEGTVSYVTAQNVYVKFSSTEQINVGDTLFAADANGLLPVLRVKELSSISCVCVPLSNRKFKTDDRILSRTLTPKPVTPEPVAVQPAPVPLVSADTPVTDTASAEKKTPAPLKQKINGRISVSSYSDFSSETDLSQRMRYNFSMDAANIGNSKLSAETYISFSHKLGEWNSVKADPFSALKIYSLSLNYAVNPKNSIWLGRHLNPNLSNAGAIDGIQYETKFNSFTAGVIAGSRPDFENYGFNFNLIQYGGYLSHTLTRPKGNMQNTLAFIEQTNNGRTDRRFAYLQHSNMLITNLYFFGSMEVDLFNMTRNSADSSLVRDKKPNFSNFYVMLRYRMSKQFTFSLSYSARQNVIYYESYKNIIDLILESATMKGYTVQMNYRPLKYMTLGANGGYRFSKTDPRPSWNLYAYLTYASLPGLKASATASYTLMHTGYLDGNIYSVGLSRDLFKGKLYGGMSYRFVNYKFVNAELPLNQHMGELDLSWRVSRKFSCSFNYEGTFEKGRNFDRIYVNLTQRF
jgi:hypothetical protein